MRIRLVRNTGLVLSSVALLAGVAGCGHESPGQDRPASTSQPAARPNATRLIAGPIVLRIRDAPKPTAINSTPQLLYAVVFRLDRTPTPGRDRAIKAQTQYGNYSILDTGWSNENTIGPFGEEDSHCFIGTFDRENVTPSLQELELGQHVAMTLRPTTRSPHGDLILENFYERSPRLLQSDYHLRSQEARAALQRIGCLVPRGPLLGYD